MTVRRDAPSTAARTVSRDEPQTPNRTSPGSTTGTSRCEAHSCHGATAGSQSTVPTDQAMIRNGSPHSRAAMIDDRPSITARTSRRPSTAAPAQASSTAGTPRYHRTQ